MAKVYNSKGRAPKVSSKKPGASSRQGKPPARWSEEMKAKIVEMLENGYTTTMVRDELNIAAVTWKTWMYKGPEKGGRVELKGMVNAAKRYAQTNMLDLVQMHAQNDWRAAAWYLERTSAEFKLKTFRSKEAQAEMDSVYIEKAQAERDLVRAKTKALQKNIMTPEELLDVLKDAREIRKSDKNAVH